MTFQGKLQRIGVALLPALLLCPAAQATQEPLQNPRIASRAGAAVPVTLTATNGSVTVPGIGRIDDLFLYGVDQDTPSLAPATLQVQQGQTLQVKLKNQLDCGQPANADGIAPDQTNLHTHGLIVSPHAKDKKGQYGDNVFVTVQSEATGCGSGSSPPHPGGMPMPSMPMEQGQASYAIEVPYKHPSGLYWYHPHVHSITSPQVNGGMSGLISIGSVWDYAYLDCNPLARDSSRCATPAALVKEMLSRVFTDQHYLMLKDVQLTKTGAGRWRNNFDFDLAPCPMAANAAPGPGYCDSPDGSKRWLFTVNGQHMPKITVGQGRGAILRIANVSANVTHLLRLRVTGGDGRVRSLPFQVLAVDGVARITSTFGAATNDSILMMPATRSELFLSAGAICDAMAKDGAADLCRGTLHATLEQVGVIAPGGDSWPRIDMATVDINMEGNRFQNSFKVIDMTAAGQSSLVGLPVLTFPMHKNPSLSAPKMPRTPQYCQDGSPALTLNEARGEYRLITFNAGFCPNGTASGCTPGAPGTPFEFVMATESNRVLTHTPADVVPNTPYKSFDHSRVDLCVGAPIASGNYAETWVVSNRSGILHNFHVHQSKFEVIESSADTQTNTVGNHALREGVFHDTYPVDPGGWIKLRIRFDQPEQVGSYMYHCHVLSHEDLGMMSVIEVVNTSGK